LHIQFISKGGLTHLHEAMVSTYTELEKLCEQIPGLKAKEEKSLYMQKSH